MDLLRGAVTDGRLSPDTFLVRLDAALQARHQHVLARLTADLGPAAPKPATRLRAFMTARRNRGATMPARKPRPSLYLPRPGTPPLLVGRGADCNVFIDDDTVSRLHASVASTNGQWIVTDCASTNGTWVNERRIWGTCTVKPGDVLRLARCDLVLAGPPLQGA
ncbi:MAG: hypothetical protein AVDCRST_MAG34-3106 [uncultured Nocardioidaceae bacterium]|uniref:FHA domain-containing protein n=1 Tax=uncultured Nocardioidaceae bacterium TaxID=253824 RepID=A0A6J4MSG1_9ACTN|nr:MAG: hypothetical protein AVDCRST_MAG34-3106 [uncultured Nocardioidaceae bacterium]